MTLGGSDDVDVDGAHDLLDRGGSIEWGGLLSEEIGLERDHPRVGQQEGGVDRDQ